MYLSIRDGVLKTCYHPEEFLEWERIHGMKISEIYQIAVLHDMSFQEWLPGYASEKYIRYCYLLWRIFCDQPECEETTRFVIQRLESIFFFLLAENNVSMLAHILNLCDTIPKNTLDAMIEQAITARCYEIQVMLTDYKLTHTKQLSVEEISRKKFDLD